MKNIDYVRIMTDAKNKSGKTQQEIAEATGYSVSSISRFFGGKMDDIPTEFLEDMATCLGLSMAEIFAPAAQKAPAKQEAIVELLREMLSTREQEYRDTVASLKDKHAITIKELKEAHRDEIANLKKEHERELAGLIKAHDRERDYKNKWITWLFSICLTLVVFFVFILVYDVLNPEVGWVRRLGEVLFGKAV